METATTVPPPPPRAVAHLPLRMILDALIFLAVLIIGILIQSRCRNSRYRT